MENSHEDICLILGQLKGEVEQGFKSVNQRLDKMNGNIKNHDDRINVCESTIDQAKGSMKITAIIWGVIITLVNLVISFFKK